ncbi:MAG: small multi-drug export protein [Dehalococcoidales bacterium]|nr:small multi-drug export protein [Dehalococcoidales bacterium]
MEFLDILKVICIAALPISELRGAIPTAIVAFNFPWHLAYLFSVLGNILPLPFLVFFLEAIVTLAMKIPFLRHPMQAYLARTARQKKYIDRFGWLGLAIFIAIPLPFTGIWTGMVLASLVRMNPRYSVPAAIIGVIIAGALVTGATMLGWAVANLFTA